MEGGEKGGREERRKGGRKEYMREFTFILSSEPDKNVLAMEEQESEAQAGVWTLQLTNCGPWTSQLTPLPDSFHSANVRDPQARSFKS